MELILALLSIFSFTSKPAQLPNFSLDAKAPVVSFAEVAQAPYVLGDFTDSTSSTASKSLKNPKVTIALLGDSMIDTLREFDELEQELKGIYKNIELTTLNFGVGGENIDRGIERISNDYTYAGKQVTNLAKTKPDVVVIESFAYNPFPDSDGGLNRHWLSLARAVDTVKIHVPKAKIIIASTIAPNSEIFADGANNTRLTSREKIERVTQIHAYLESTTRFANGEKLPLADAYHTSMLENGEGDLQYIDPFDHIHPSVEGKKLFARILAQTLVEDQIFE